MKKIYTALICLLTIIFIYSCIDIDNESTNSTYDETTEQSAKINESSEVLSETSTEASPEIPLKQKLESLTGYMIRETLENGSIIIQKEDDGKYGLVNKDYFVLADCVYDYISNSSKNRLILCRYVNSEYIYYVIDNNGNVIIEPYLYIHIINNGNYIKALTENNLQELKKYCTDKLYNEITNNMDTSDIFGIRQYSSLAIWRNYFDDLNCGFSSIFFYENDEKSHIVAKYYMRFSINGEETGNPDGIYVEFEITDGVYKVNSFDISDDA